MYKVSEFTKTGYKVGEVADILGVSTKTIRNYDKLGKLKPCRTEGNHRLIMREEILSFLDERGLLLDDSCTQKRDVIYARVSSHEQKEKGDLDRQVLFLAEHVQNLQNPLILKEVGSGLNDKRKYLQNLISMVMNNEVRNIYVTYKDRLTRFGFHYLETAFLAHGVNIIVVKDISTEKSVQEELVEDMMSLIASFSGKLYGMRSRRKKTESQKGDVPVMDKITNLNELLEAVPEEVVKKCFMEYMMLTIAKAEKLEQIENAVCKKNVTMKEIRRILGE